MHFRTVLQKCRLEYSARSPPVDSKRRQRPSLIVKQRIGAGDFRVTIHRNPEAGWHATIYGRQPAEVHRCQVMGDTIATELCQRYELDE
jgi:hypothetical protein